jgi:hypothetical protein
MTGHRLKAILRLAAPILLSLATAWALLSMIPPDRVTLARETTAGSSACSALTEPMERDLCRFVTGIYPDGLLTNWPNPRLPGHLDHAPMRDYGENQPAISESASMLALYAALVGDQATFDALFDVSAPPELGGTGASVSGSQEAPYYFASPNLCLLHWILDANGYKDDQDSHWLASAAGEENRWLEALSIADQRFSDPKYRLFANCLAWGLMGATDFNAAAIGNFEDPGTPEAFDDYLLRPYFGWQDDFDGFATTTAANLSYNNLIGWRYAAQLGQESHALTQTTNGAGGIEIVAVPLQAVGSIRLDMTQRGTGYGYSLREVEAYSPFTDSNLLLGTNCAASSYQDDVNCPVCTCEKALDGDPLTRWSSQQPAHPGGPLAPQWLVITPTHPSRVMTITLRWEAAHAPSYSLTASWPFAGFFNNVLNYIAPLMAGSVRNCGTDLPRVMYDVERHFYYGEILTPNLTCAMPVTATTSSTQSPELAAANASDCNSTSRWSSDWDDDEWIALEFGKPATIDSAVLKWEAAYGKAYTLDVSDDGTTWTPVYTQTNGDGGKDEIHFPLTTARYVRMHGLQRGTEFGYSLWEFEVYRGGTSSLTALDLAQRAGAYARVSGDRALWGTGRRVLKWYKARYPSIAAAYDPCTGNPLPGWEYGDWTSIMADLAELAAEYCDHDFARQVIEEKLRPKLITDPDSPLYGSVGPSVFENLEVLLGLRPVDECCCLYIPLVLKSR